jgi:DNA-binding transcriptional regulator YiaG
MTDLLTEVQALRRLPTPAVRRERRERIGISQARFAKEVGVDRSTFCNWESGRHDPRGENLVRYVTLIDALTDLVDALDVENGPST